MRFRLSARTLSAAALAPLLALTMIGAPPPPPAQAAPLGARLVLDGTVGSGLSGVQGGTPLGTVLVYRYASPGYGSEPWVSDGTAAGTHLLKDVNPGSKSSNLSTPVAFAGRLYFLADDGAHGTELWSTDGTASGTQMVVDLYPGAIGALASGGEIVVSGGRLFFDGLTPDADDQLFVSDGTAAGTHVVKQIGTSAKGANIQGLTPWGGRVVFAAADGSGSEPWISNGTASGTAILKDVNAGSGGSSPGNFAPLGSRLMFTASTSGSVATSLFVSDISSTTELMPTGLPDQAISLGDTVLFVNSGGGKGAELWRTDGTTNGTLLVKDIDPTAGQSSFVDDLTLFKGKVYFRANDSANNGELWSSDGTTAGTLKVKEINPSGGSFPSHFVAAGDLLYFSAQTAAAGTELWQTDGTTSGTRLSADVRPGPDSSYATPVASIGTALFFGANDGEHGEELYVTGDLPGPPAPASPTTPAVGAAPSFVPSSTSVRRSMKVGRTLASARRIRVSVKVTAPGTVPSGTVVLKKGSRVVGSGKLLHGRVRIRITRKLSKGSTKIRAYYAGQPTIRPSRSPVLTIRVR